MSSRKLPAMLTRSDFSRIVKSRHILSLYEQNGLPGGPKAETLRILGQEIDLLNEIASRGEGESIAALVRRWEELRDRVASG